MAALIIAVLMGLVIVVALCLKERVKTGVRLWSFGFFLEADNATGDKSEGSRVLKD